MTMRSRPWTFILNEITIDAEKAFRQLHASWEEENLKPQGMCDRMNAIRQELLKFWKSKIEEEKLHVLKYKVEQLRNEIQTWWGKCFLSEEEREDFIEFKSTDYTELLLDCHVKELQRLKKKFTNNEHLFSLIKKHQDTWNHVVSMDKQLFNPERLFQNRGAQLLQEEKARKAAQKDLPRLEELIKIETINFERENGRPFFVFGKRFSEMILHQKEQHKENQNSLRTAQENSIQQNGSSLKKLPSSCYSSKHVPPRKCGEAAASTNPVPVKATTVSKLKRKLNNTPSPASSQTQSKMAKIATYDQKPSKFARPLNARHRLPVRRKLIDKNTNVPPVQSSHFP